MMTRSRYPRATLDYRDQETGVTPSVRETCHLSEKYKLAYPFILARIKGAAQRWRFTLPLTMWAQARSLGPFGGGLLEVRASEQDMETMELVGVVEGPLLSADAAKESERCALEFFGACIALGLATLQEPPPGWWDYDVGGTDIRLVLEALGEYTYSPASHGLWGLTARISFGEGSPLLRLTDLEKHALTTNAQVSSGGLATRLLGRLFGGDSDRHVELRNACRLFLEAYGAADHGTSVLYGSLCLEGVLLEPRSKADVLARLTEAVAYRIGRSAGERQDLRKLVKQLYDDRSTYVHTGRLQRRDDEAERWNDLLARVLNKEIAELDP